MATNTKLDVPIVDPIYEGFGAEYIQLAPDVVYVAQAEVAPDVGAGDVFTYTPLTTTTTEARRSTRQARNITRIAGPTTSATRHVLHPAYVVATLSDDDDVQLWISRAVCRRISVRDQQASSIIADGYVNFTRRVIEIMTSIGLKDTSAGAVYAFLGVDPSIATKWRKSSSVSPSVLFDLCWRYRVDPLWVTGYVVDTNMGVDDLCDTLMETFEADELYIRKQSDEATLVRVAKRCEDA